MKEEISQAIKEHRLENTEALTMEYLTTLQTQDVAKDILIVVKDQLEYIKICIDSIYENTTNFTLYIWDNASGIETKTYLESLKSDNVFLIRSEENIGFLEPNNKLIELGTSPYVILLNSDTLVANLWDKALIGWLQTHPDTLEVGYAGSRLNEEFKGGPAHFGYEVDYLPGWAICISRETYNKFGLFDGDNLEFAYCEDADFSLRIKEAGYKIYAMHVDFVTHFENKTSLAVSKDTEFLKVISHAFNKNHVYMKNRWSGTCLTYRERHLS